MFPLQDTIPARRLPVVNILLIVSNVIVFLFELRLSPTALEALFHNYGLVPAYFYQGKAKHWIDYYPFLTNMFLHGGWAHLIGNLWTLWIFGDNVEDRMGPAKYLIFYLLCGIVASYIHYLVNINSTLPAVGASGAISGVMGAYMFLFPQSRIIFFLPIFFLPYFVELSAFVYLAFWFIGQLISGTASLFIYSSGGGIAFWAHIGGFAAGALTYRLFINVKEHRYCRECDEASYAYRYRYRNYY